MSAPGIEVLSPREREVLKLMGAAMTNDEISAVLGISEKTTSTHRVRMLNKLKLDHLLRMYRLAWELVAKGQL